MPRYPNIYRMKRTALRRQRGRFDTAPLDDRIARITPPWGRHAVALDIERS